MGIGAAPQPILHRLDKARKELGLTK